MAHVAGAEGGTAAVARNGSRSPFFPDRMTLANEEALDRKGAPFTFVNPQRALSRLPRCDLLRVCRLEAGRSGNACLPRDPRSTSARWKLGRPSVLRSPPPARETSAPISVLFVRQRASRDKDARGLQRRTLGMVGRGCLPSVEKLSELRAEWNEYQARLNAFVEPCTEGRRPQSVKRSTLRAIIFQLCSEATARPPTFRPDLALSSAIETDSSASFESS